jgi:hypothetical protein
MKICLAVMATLVTASAYAQGTAAKKSPTETKFKTAAERRELTPGPRPLTKGWVRDARAAYIARAKNDVATFMRYTADEFYAWNLENKIRTKEDLRKDLIEMASKGESNMIDPNMPKLEDPLVLRKDETLVLAGNTAVATQGGSIDGVPVRMTNVWVYREGRWQRLFSESVKVAGDRNTPK